VLHVWCWYELKSSVKYYEFLKCNCLFTRYYYFLQLPTSSSHAGDDMEDEDYMEEEDLEDLDGEDLNENDSDCEDMDGEDMDG
jgi:hypothetical protein